VITGKEGNEPVHEAVVLLIHTNIGATTDTNGNFSINASTCNTLVISNMAYETVTIPVDGKSNPVIRLKKDNKSLTEIVVTALDFSRQVKSLECAVQAENRQQLTEAEEPNLTNNLNRKIAGVVNTNGGAGVGSTSRMVVRGEDSFNGTNQPLFIVDGVPIHNETFFNNAIENSSGQGSWAEVDWANGTSEINPNDISKVTVLKGSTATALYGSRSANVAVVINNQKGTLGKASTQLLL
jgi:outer membrane receptor protein involved in Fe transport